MWSLPHGTKELWAWQLRDMESSWALKEEKIGLMWFSLCTDEADGVSVVLLVVKIEVKRVRLKSCGMSLSQLYGYHVPLYWSVALK